MEKPQFRSLTPKTWRDLESLFGPRGASSGCWCMWWRLRRSQWNAQKGAGNKKAFRKVVAAGSPTGVIAYVAGRPAAWCAVAPRSAYPVLDRSPTLKPVDDEPVWSVTCFFIPREFRGRGLSVGLLEAVKRYVRRSGGRTVEGYPVQPKKGRMPDAFAWTGLASAFRKAGFKQVERRGARAIVRCEV